jgi:lipopolysaccharide transport system ATP-binding protein
MSNIVISVNNLSKSYDLGEIGSGTLSKDINRWVAKLLHKPDPYQKVTFDQTSNSSKNTILALDNVSFQVTQGEVLGIIGNNGAGKSTLLKILSRVTAPSSGNIKIKGRIGSLLEVGTGFHPELSGRENVFLNGTILGMNNKEVGKKFEEIVDFSGVEKYIDTPVKRYSSGMYVRLAFAVAAHLDPEILIVDEVLAVGDAEFQQKCIGKMGNIANSGRTVLFVSHNMQSIFSLCPHSLFLEKGRIKEFGETREIINNYISSQNNTQVNENIVLRTDRLGSGVIKITDLNIGIDSDPTCGYWITGRDVIVTVDYTVNQQDYRKNIELAIIIKKLDKSKLLYLGTKVVNQNVTYIENKGKSECKIFRLPLEPGSYYIGVELAQNGNVVDFLEIAKKIEVAVGDFYGTNNIWPYGGFLCDYRWDHEGDNRN